MSPEQARLVAVLLVALAALLVGFQGASTLLTVTELGASPSKPQPARSHASLVPQPPVPVIKPAEPKAAQPTAAPTISAGEEAPSAGGPTPVPGEQPAAQVVTDNQAGVAAAARSKAQAEMDALGDRPDEDVRQQAPAPRRYRAPRPELHKVY
jgi:hypothetical protein